ncbi:MAG: dsRNA-specific ribonuclease, partial [Parvicellaceae bacterium]
LRETDTDYKSQLLIWSQKNGLKLEYRVTEVQSKVTKYLAKLYVDSDFVSEAIGRSKKEAEKLAARSAFKKLI